MITVLELPGNIQQAFQYAATEMLESLTGSCLRVVLVDAPYSQFPGHKIRVAVEHNTEWYKRVFASRERKVDRESVKLALTRVITLKYKKFGRHEYNRLVFEAIENYLVDVIEDIDVINYLKTGVPF